MSVVAMQIISAATTSMHANSSSQHQSWQTHTNDANNTILPYCHATTSIHANNASQAGTIIINNAGLPCYDGPSTVDACIAIGFALICVALAIYIIRDYRKTNTKHPAPISDHHNQPLTPPTTQDTDNTNEDTYNPYDPHKNPEEYRYIPRRNEEDYAE